MNLKHLTPEQVKQQLNEGLVDLDTAQKLYRFMIKKFTPMALADGLRMSHFESEYPTFSSFYNDLQKNIR